MRGLQSPAPARSVQGRPRERKRKKKRERERERKGEGAVGGSEGSARGRAGGRARPRKAQPVTARPPRPTPGAAAALTFQVAAGGRRQPLLRFAAHQLQADLQHFRVPAAWGTAPPLLRRAAQARLAPQAPRALPGPRGPAMRPPRRPARPPRAAAASPPRLRTRLLTKGPEPRPARPAPTVLTPSAPRPDPLPAFARPRPALDRYRGPKPIWGQLLRQQEVFL